MTLAILLQDLVQLLGLLAHLPHLPAQIPTVSRHVPPRPATSRQVPPPAMDKLQQVAVAALPACWRRRMRRMRCCDTSVGSLCSLDGLAAAAEPEPAGCAALTSRT